VYRSSKSYSSSISWNGGKSRASVPVRIRRRSGKNAFLRQVPQLEFNTGLHQDGSMDIGSPHIRAAAGPAISPLDGPEATMNHVAHVEIRPARRDDVPAIVAMLADDALGRSRERIEDPLPSSYFQAFERVERDPNIQLVVAEGEGGAVVGCLQLCILPGLSSQGASRALIEDVRVASHCRSRGIGELLVQWAVAEARGKGCKLVELLTHNTRVDAQRFYARLGFQASHVGMTVRF
jgi:ribosomal protein S18 acetylase RimI-like enzyme